MLAWSKQALRVSSKRPRGTIEKLWRGPRFGCRQMSARARLLAVLSLPASADHAAIKTRYRQLAKALHPDINPGCATSAERFALVTDAFQQ